MSKQTSLPAITLAADDYGLAPGVSQAIRQLIAQGRLQATGCMTASPHWPDGARLLKHLDGLADIGLHLTLTDHAPLTPMPKLAPHGRLPGIAELVKRSHAGRIDSAEIQAEIEAQLDSFEAHFGRAPDFIDGHHHVHQLPGIGAAVIAAWRRRCPQAWIRSCHEPACAILRRGIDPVRALIISTLGWRFRRQLRAAGVPHNSSFRGVYDFSGRVPFAELFRRFTDHPGEHALMMVHPGFVDEALIAADSLTTQREAEYAFLESEACPLSLAARGVSFRRLFP